MNRYTNNTVREIEVLLQRPIGLFKQNMSRKKLDEALELYDFNIQFYNGVPVKINITHISGDYYYLTTERL